MLARLQSGLCPIFPNDIFDKIDQDWDVSIPHSRKRGASFNRLTII